VAKKEYSGINIQWPISELILTGKKTIETRTYPIPNHYLNKEMILIETPGKKGNFKSRMRGIILFTDCFEYENKSAFYKDSKKHCVTPNSEWAWIDKPKWGWKVEIKKLFPKPLPLQKRAGIKFSRGIFL
jgi:hypothetical protein